MKKLAKAIVVTILGWQVRRLHKKHSFKVVAVAGSIGKTSTKLAIVQVLEQKLSVRYQAGNYNDIVTAPLIFFGLAEPSLFNPVAWLRTILTIERQLHKPYPYDVVVVEVGTDYPGNIEHFKKYLRADVGVLTAIAPEHMESFASLDQVAHEELTIAQLSSKLVVNEELVDAKYLEGVDVAAKYGREAIGADPQRYSLAAAATVGRMMGLSQAEINAGLQEVRIIGGRGRRLAGINNSIIIDDTYNASPEAVKAALDMLYEEKANQKIAILGSMNELGKFSKDAHAEVGEYCDPAKVDIVVALGPDAAEYLAPAATKSGCQVKSFDNPYDAAGYIRPLIQPGALILAKGSQNKVFAEEAVKLLLADPADRDKLVRQSAYWLKIKSKQFGSVSQTGAE